MSKFFIGFLSAAQLVALHNAGHAVETFALTEPQKLVATLKTTSIGATVAAEVANLKDQSISGAEKFAKALLIATPLVVNYVAEDVWQIVTDADNRVAGGLNLCAVWVPHSGPAPSRGTEVEWGPHHVWWTENGAEVRVHKIDHEFDPNDPHLFTG